MQLANCLLALNGDRGNSVPKYNVTAAEIAVLMAIHGGDAVYDIDPQAQSVDRSMREEKDRLFGLYTARDDDGKFFVEVVYPGTAPLIHKDLADLGLPEDLFVAVERRAAERPAPAAPKTKRAAKTPVPAPAPLDVKSENSADDLFDDDEEDTTETAGVMA